MRITLTQTLILSGVLVLLSVTSALAWTGPTQTAPNGNVSAPINVGTTDQVKNSALGINGLAVFGNSLLQASSYLNWGATAGTNGYGIRDNAGTLEFKNSGGSWGSLQSIICSLTSCSGGGVLTGSGTANYITKFTAASTVGNSQIFDNGTSVGIGTVSPAAKLDVNGSIAVSGVSVVQQGGNDVYLNARVIRNNSATLQDGMYINYNSNGTANPIRFYTPGTTMRMIVNYDGNVGINNAAPAYTLDVGGDVRGARFFDQNDTSYYSDPNSVSYFNDLRPNIIYDKNNSGYYLDPNNTSRTNYTIADRIDVPIMYDANNGGYYVDPNNTSRMNYTIFDNAYSYGWMQAGVFYDANNNGYYLDPNGSSNVNVLYGAQFLYASDRRLKTKVQSLGGALSKLLRIEGVSFEWLTGERKGESDVGVIAQDVEKVLPEAVQTNAEGIKSVDYPRLVPLLINAIKEQQGEIDALTRRLEALEQAR